MKDQQMEKKKRGIDDEITALLEEVVDKWETLDRLLKAEWKYLLRDDFSRLYKIFQIKENLANRIARDEEELSKRIHSKIKDIPPKETRNNAELLLTSLGYKKGSYTLELLKRRQRTKQLVALTNGKTFFWLKERLKFLNELSNILSGNTLKKDTCYHKKTSKRPFLNNHLSSPKTTSTRPDQEKELLKLYERLQKGAFEGAR